MQNDSLRTLFSNQGIARMSHKNTKHFFQEVASHSAPEREIHNGLNVQKKCSIEEYLSKCNKGKHKMCAAKSNVCRIQAAVHVITTLQSYLNLNILTDIKNLLL